MKAMTSEERLLVDLLKIDSVTGNEAAVARRIVPLLKGFRVRRQPVSGGRFNIIAEKGRSDVWMVAHMDTVPPFLPVRVTNDKIFGRGAIDNKGNLVGAILAARQMDDINLLFTVGEEVGFDGVRAAKVKGKAIILEPTSFKTIFSQCGVVSAHIVARGEQKHSSLLASDKESATHVLINTLDALIAKRWHRFNVGIVAGGIAENVVAGTAEARISVRPRDPEEFADILDGLRAVKGARVEIINKLPPFRSAFADDVHLGERSGPATFFSELSFFKKGLLFGAGSIVQAHTAGEHIARKDFKRLPGELIRLAERLKAL